MTASSMLVLGAVALLAASMVMPRGGDAFRVGVGIADVTGPPVEITFLGYGKMEQKGSGIHLRQFSRSFIIEKDGRRVVFISVDTSMMAHGVRAEVVSRLAKRFGPNAYPLESLVVSATHTHSTPGGFMQHMLFDLSTLGFVRQTFDALVDGIVKSVEAAHVNVQDARIHVADGELLEANINRSPTAYLNNPQEERAKYSYDVDKTMTQLRFTAASTGAPLGVISWFAVHPTSMNNTNTLISSDNVGYAAVLMEKRMNPGKVPGKGDFVAAFASSNLGDVSPNTRGPRCRLSGGPCDSATSACPGGPSGGDQCIASGPGVDMFDSTRIIAQKLADKAWDLWRSEGREVLGDVRVVHQFVDMPTQRVPDRDNPDKLVSQRRTLRDVLPRANPDAAAAQDQCMPVQGCLPAMGYSFGAGTTDGPGAFSFTQATKSPNALWNALRDFLAVPTKEDVACQEPKPILIATGQMDFPFEWQPRVVSTQLALIGDVALAAVPGEFTTMAGRRLRRAVADALPAARAVVVAGLVATYSDYIVTYEEYQVQRYEGASTIYGPNTLDIYLEQYRKLGKAIATDSVVPAGPEPPEMLNDMISLTPPVIFDTPRWEHNFGDCIRQPAERVAAGDTVTARFVAGNPRNHLQHGGSYMAVERRDVHGNWTLVATDADWETKFRWERTSIVLGNSEVIASWQIPDDVTPGEHRIRHFGHYKYIFGGVFPYRGSSRSFNVVGAESNRVRSRSTRFSPRN